MPDAPEAHLQYDCVMISPNQISVAQAPSILAFNDWVVACHNQFYLEMMALDLRADELRPLAMTFGFESEAWQEYEGVCIEMMNKRGEWKLFAAFVVPAYGNDNTDTLPTDGRVRVLWERYCSLTTREASSTNAAKLAT